jgi:hypothetical protein
MGIQQLLVELPMMPVQALHGLSHELEIPGSRNVAS